MTGRGRSPRCSTSAESAERTRGKTLGRYTSLGGAEFNVTAESVVREALPVYVYLYDRGLRGGIDDRRPARAERRCSSSSRRRVGYASRNHAAARATHRRR